MKEPFSALLLGLYDDDQQLAFAGHVGTGLAQGAARQIYSILRKLHTQDCPFKNPPKVQQLMYWCRPEIVCQVEYGEFTVDGKLRYPVFIALRDDKSPTDCRIVDAPGWPSALSYDR